MAHVLSDALAVAASLSVVALAICCAVCLVSILYRCAAASALRKLPPSAAWALLAFALGLMPTVAKRAGTTGVPPVVPARGGLRSGSSDSDFWLSYIGPSTNSVELGVAWLPGVFAAPPFIEFTVSTNLSIGAWTLLGWAEAEAGETNLSVEVDVAQLPGGMVPPTAFFKATAYDGLGADDEDDDGDGIPNGWERSHGTNPRRVDTDSDGIPDGVEAAWASVDEPFPELDLSSLTNVLAGTLPYSVFPATISVSLPFAVEMAGGISTNAVVHVNGMVAFPEVGSSTNMLGFSQYAQPESLYATDHGIVAAYGFSFLMMGYTGSQIRAGVVQDTHGRWFVAEWRDMADPMGFANLTLGSATFRLAVSETDPSTFRVQYVDVEGIIDPTQALFGAHGFGGTPSFSLSDGVTNGMTVAYHFGVGTDPTNADTDGDCLPDGWEAAYGMNPLVANTGDPRMDANADPDLDGLTNLEEAAQGTDPFQPDTDGDGMDDGWETRYGFDPCTHNSQTERTDDDANADPDGDGLTNAEECAWGTNPGSPDSDGDGVTDNAEIAQNSDPAEPTDEGKPNSRVAMSFVFGDHSSSHSEKYRLTVSPVPTVGETNPPRTFSWVNAEYGACETRTAMLTPGRSYEVRLVHASTNRSQGPDYDYTLNAVSIPQSVILSDPDGLFGVHLSSSTFTGAGLVATVAACKLDVAICAPDDESWAELDASRVVLDNESLRVQVTVAPQMGSLSAVQQKWGNSLVIKTSGTCPQGGLVSLDDAVFLNCGDRSEIRVMLSFLRLRQLGILPSQDEDGVDEMAWYDIGDDDPASLSNLSDSNAFAQLGYAFRGKILQPSLGNLDSYPPVSSNSESFYQSGGVEIVTAHYGGTNSLKRQIMNQADYFYYSGHGRHSDGCLKGLTGGPGLTPALVAPYWNRDLKCVVFAGCSVLDINDYNGKYVGTPEHGSSPGKLWAAVEGPESFLGYAYKAPRDTQGAGRIASDWVTLRGNINDVDAWMTANDNSNGRNACAIDNSRNFHYFKKVLWKTYKRTFVPKASQ